MEDEDIQTLLEYYQEQSQVAQAKRSAEREIGIRELLVHNPAAPIAERLVSVALENADVAMVIDQLQLNYTLQDLDRLEGRVSARFAALAMPDALAAILNPVHYQAVIKRNTVRIMALPSSPERAAAPNEFVLHKQVLRYADTRELESVLQQLFLTPKIYTEDNNGDTMVAHGVLGAISTTRFSYAPLHAENAILLKGPFSDVEHARDILNAVDTQNRHIMLEATVLEFSATQLLKIGTRVSNGAKGEFSDVSIDWGSMIGETIAFTNLAGAANTRTFRAALSLMLQKDYARVIARPYLAAVSGQAAKIEVAEDRYVTTFTDNSGEVTLEPVTSGVTMSMTPFLLPDAQVRMDIDVSISQFVPSLENVQLTRTRSDASSIMRIGSGETLVIGGLMAEESSRSSLGVPGVRSIPGLGYLFGEKERSDVGRRLLIYITPYVWEPGMETPVDSQQDLERFLERQGDSWKRGRVEPVP